jgi:hypothetical protein
MIGHVIAPGIPNLWSEKSEWALHSSYFTPEEHPLCSYLIRSWTVLDVVYLTDTVDKVRHCHYLSIPANACQYLPLRANTFHYLPILANTCHCLPLCTCHYLPLLATMYLPLPTTTCHYVLAITCDYLLLCTCHYLPLLATTARLVLFGLLVDSKPRPRGWFTWRTFVACRCLPRRGNGALLQESPMFLGPLKPTIIVAFPRLAFTCDKQLYVDSQHRSVCRVAKWERHQNVELSVPVN